MEHIRFGDVLLLTSEAVEGPFRTELIGKFESRDDYSKCVCATLGGHTKTAFNLVIHWDGFILDPGAWWPEFLDYDYIGASWPWHKDGMDVGNGGFCLRSKKILDKVATYELPSMDAPFADDEFMCRMIRPDLEREGIRFAPVPVANLFSYERGLPNKPTFGFHGLFNMWRHVDDAEMAENADKLADYLVGGREWLELISVYFALRKFVPLEAYYKRLRRKFSLVEVKTRLQEVFPHKEAYVAEIFQLCEGML
jgi:hypothetical protein